MALGNKIVLTPEPRGRRTEGIIEGALLPGTCVQVKAATEPDAGNRYTWVPYNRAGSGVPWLVAVLDFDQQQGKTADDAYTSGRRGFIYFPLPGDELNLLVQDQAGTGATSDFAIGDALMIEDGTGLLIDGNVGTAEYISRPFVNMETYNDMSADTRLHVMFTGY